tara:strand:+ start:111 stop:4052 length:3942 start_codon:yes stop_codon:yes gene_type:complete
MAINNDDIFASFLDDLQTFKNLPEGAEETEEEKKKREEEERLNVLKESEPIEVSEVDVPVESKKNNFPASETEKKVMSSFLEDLEKQSLEEKDYTSLDGISTTRRIQFGARQEPTIAGNTYRLLKAGVQAAFSDETFSEAAQRIEKDRQDKIYEQYPEFRGRKEDLAVISGRMGVAISDPVTFFIPWAKIAKAGKLATVAAGGTVAGVDVALRDKALNGEISFGNVAVGTLLGGSSAGIGDVIARKISASRKQEKLVTVDKEGKPVVTPLKETDPIFVGPLPEQTQKALLEISEDVFAVSQPFITRFQDNISTLGVKFQERDLIISEIAKIKKKLSQSKTYENIKDPKIAPGLKGMQTGRTTKEQDLINLQRSIDDYDKQLITLQKEIDELTLIKQPENISIIGFNSLKQAYDKGLLKGTMGENLVRALVHETVRPLAGATAGGLVALAMSDGETDTELTYGLIAGAVLGLANKRIENYKFDLNIKKAYLDEHEKVFQNSWRTFFKKLMAGSHSAKLQAGNPIIQKFGKDVVKIQGASTETGEVLEQSVEELTAYAQDYYRRELYKITGSVDDDTLLAAGRLVQQHNMPSNAKHSFLITGDKDNVEAIRVANKFLALNKSFKQYVNKTGVFYKEVDSYGLTQIIDPDMVRYMGRENAEDLLTEAFRIQNKNQHAKDNTIELLSDKSLREKAIYYLNNSDGIRRQEMMSADALDKQLNALVKNNGAPIKDDETIIQSARFFDNERTLFDQEARAYAKEIFIQDPEFTFTRLFENTIPVTEFARRFGARGAGIKDVINDLKKYYSQFGDIERNESLRALLRDDVKTISQTVNALFKVHDINAGVLNNDLMKSIVLTLQTLLSTTKLTKVALPSLGDLVQTMQNSGFRAAYNSMKRQLKQRGAEVDKPSASMALRNPAVQTGKILSEPLLGRSFVGRRYNGTLEKELSDFNLTANTKYQKSLINYQQRFFEIVQLGRVTRFAREFAYDAGAFRAFDLGKLAVKGRLKPSRLRELNSQLGLSVENAKYLGKFESMDDAYRDKIGRMLIDRAGRKAADRDALIPTVGNRRLFSQSNNPFVKFAGSFLSWAQAKTSQTNSLLRRVEDGDAKLALMVLSSLPVYATIRQLQIEANPNEEFRKDFGSPYKNLVGAISGKEDLEINKFLKLIADSALFSGQVLPFTLDKAIQGYKFNSDDTIETMYPVFGLMNDFASGVYDVLSIQEPAGGAIKIVESTVPFAKEITRREAVGEALGLERSIKEEAKVIDKGITPIPQFSTGGFVKGPFVPFTKENSADRVNPITGLPYSAPVITYGDTEDV